MRHGSSHQQTGEGWTVRTEGPRAGSSERWSGLFDENRHAADIRLTLPARPENVGLVRHMLCALAEALGLPSYVCDDLKLAVTEACTNVVRHAYHDGGGAIDILARPTAEGMQIIVSDHGAGIGPSPDTAGPGFGLSLISSLADRLEIDHDPGQGSRLAMWFERHRPIPETA